MRFDKVVSKVRGRRVQVAMAAVALLVLAGTVVAIVGEGPSDQVAEVGTRVAQPEGLATTSGANSSRDEAVMSTDEADTAGAPAVGGGSAAATGAMAQTAPSLAGAEKAGAKVVKTANLRVQVRKNGFRSAFDRAALIAEQHGGYVASSNQATVDDEASEGTLTIRVPADRFVAARTALAGLGKVEHLEIGGQDVTAQIVDYDARIRSLQAQEQSLSAILGRARSVGEVLEVQGQLFNVRQQVEQLQAERANLDAQASMATITAIVFEPGAAPANKPDPEPATGLARSFERAWDAALAVIGGMVIVTGVVLPLVALALAGWAVWRLSAGRRRSAPVSPAA